MPKEEEKEQKEKLRSQPHISKSERDGARINITLRKATLMSGAGLDRQENPPMSLPAQVEGNKAGDGWRENKRLPVRMAV
ncbi:MAG: hypothetical protein Q9175_001213 [Cornicularia normoerica]